MDDAVSDALQARADGPEGLMKMLLVSVAAHVVLMAFAALAPASLWLRPIDARSTTVTIDLGPSTGPDTEGLTAIGSRPVQRAVPNPPKARPTPPPAATDAATPSPAATDASTNTRERTPTPAVGREVLAGNAPAGADVQSASMGLRTTAGGGTGAQVNVGDFCCPEYIATMIQRVHQHWNSSRGGGAVTTMKFTIQRDGAITDVQLVRSSGNQMLDFLAQRALLAVRQLPPLPDAYPNPSLVIDLHFDYQR
jgi:periplasmic protein TonB